MSCLLLSFITLLRRRGMHDRKAFLAQTNHVGLAGFGGDFWRKFLTAMPLSEQHLSFLDRATGTFSRLTGTFSRLTGTFSRLTGSFSRLTGSLSRSSVEPVTTTAPFGRIP